MSFKGKISPQQATVHVGDRIQFNCSSTNSRTHIKTTWIFKEGPILDLPYIQGPVSININPVQLYHAGTYICFGLELTHLFSVYFVSYAKLQVLGKLVTVSLIIRSILLLLMY